MSKSARSALRHGIRRTCLRSRYHRMPPPPLSPPWRTERLRRHHPTRGTGGSLMARSTASGSSNNPLERWDAIRRGTSSSTSGSTPDRSGTSGTIALPSPVPSVGNLSSRDQPPRPASSSADLTAGSGRGTGSSPASLSGSSEVSAPPKAATPAPAPEADLPTEQIMAMAREAYFSRNFDESERLLGIAEEKGEDPVAIASARGYLRDARNAATLGAPPRPAPSGAGSAGDAAGPSEADPASGGFVVP